MQRRTYGIVAAGVLASAGVVWIVQRSTSAHLARLQRHNTVLAAERLCRALEASRMLLRSAVAPATGEAAGAVTPAPAARLVAERLSSLAALGLTPARPPSNVMASRLAPSRAHADTGVTRDARGRPEHRAVSPSRAGIGTTPCISDGGTLPVQAIPDPADRTVLWLTPFGAAERSAPWLRFSTLHLLPSGRSGAGIGLLPLPATGAPSPVPFDHRVRFDGQVLGLTLPPGSLDGEEEHELLDRALAWPLGGALLLFLLGLAAFSEQRGRHQRHLLERFWQDRQTGMLSRIALDHDLQTLVRPSSGAWAPPIVAEEPGLLVMVTLRLLERQRSFQPDEEISRLFLAASEAVKRHPRAGQRVRCYRASENRLAAILPLAHAAPERDRQLLKDLQSSVSAAIQRISKGLLRDDDILVTGQRLRSDASGPALLQMHGFAEIVAAEAGSSSRLLESTDAAQVRQAFAIRDALRQLNDADIELHFQPILLLANPGQFALEGLIRFRQPLLRQQPVGALISLAHELGITHQIDALVIARMASVQTALAGSSLLSERIDYISINISIDSIATPERLEQLIACLRQHCIDPSRVCLELIETPGQGVHGASVSAASERLIRELGFRILIDDFGSGLSNYQRICAAWYDTIKLDIDLVNGLGDSLRMQRYLGSFIEAVHGLGKIVVAEGVEGHGDLAAAIRLGVDGLQGYLIARPMSWEKVGGFLAESPWASAAEIEAMVARLRSSDRLMELPGADVKTGDAVPLERYILDQWFELRSFEEFLLLFVNELRSWGLDLHRLSLAFLPDEDDIDCSQYVWYQNRPGDVATLRMDRSFLEQEEHLSSPLHYIATRASFFRQRLGSQREISFPFLKLLKEQGCNDYLGLRLDSRGISIPVLTIALRGESSFSDEQIQRICSMSSLLSLLFYTFESERAKRMALLDPLTSLPNRRSFDSFLKSLVKIGRAHV